MIFSSSVFLFLFFPIVLIIYFIIPERFIKIRNLWLLIMSLIFYAWGEPLHVFLMLLSIVFNYFLGLLVSRSRRKIYVGISCVYNLGILFVFK